MIFFVTKFMGNRRY